MARRQVLAAIIILSAISVVAEHSTAVTVSVNNVDSLVDHAITVNSGVTFGVDVNVGDGSGAWMIYDLKLQAGAIGVFDWSGVTYRDPWLNLLPFEPHGLDPTSHAFEAVAHSWLMEPTLATLELSVDFQAPPGVYTLNVIDGKVTACPICPAFVYAQSGPDFLVDVVPEPGSALLILAGSIAIMRARRRPVDLAP